MKNKNLTGENNPIDVLKVRLLELKTEYQTVYKQKLQAFSSEKRVLFKEFLGLWQAFVASEKSKPKF